MSVIGHDNDRTPVIHGEARARVTNVSRRQFLHGVATTGAFVLAARVLPEPLWAQAAPFRTQAESAPLNPSVYLGIRPDGSVFIVTHRSEMGTGIRTTLPLVAADELEADWSKVTIEQGIGDTRYGDQNTDGSRSIRDFYDAFRHAGATARTMLVSAAAAQWKVAEGECEARNHQVVHRPSGRTLGYGALVPAAAKMSLPKGESIQFKSRKEWRFIGKDTATYDQKDIVTGKAQFGLDVFREGMVHASIEHPPVLGGTVKTLDDSGAKQVRGVQQTVTLDTFKPPHLFQPLGGVAVIGDNTWAVLKGRRQLKVEWNDGPHGGFESEAFKKQLISTVQQKGKVYRNLGNVDTEFAKSGAKVLEATYYTPLAAHASMEPPAAVAEVQGNRATIWAPTQNPQAVQDAVAAALGIDKKDVTCHVTLLGGGFGRKSKPDYCAEAAVLAKRLGKPVKVIWTREDDLRHDYYHTTAAVYHKATVDGRGKPTAWLHRSAFPPIASTFAPGAREPLSFELDLGLTDLPYDIANLRAENGAADAHVRIGWFRSVSNVFHAFAAHSFADEMAQAAGRDSLEFMLDMLGGGKAIDLKAQGVDYSNYGAPIEKYPVDTRRLRRVLEIAGERSGWAKRKSGGGRGMGIAAHRSFNSYVASVVEVEVDSSGALKVPVVHMVADAGVIVNPDRVRSQMEGSAVMAVGFARTSEITAMNGRIRQSNFHEFQVARMNDAPVQVNVHLVESDAPPTGVGEPGLPPVLAALGNAIFAATGKRVRELPLSRTKLA
jgi:isoquinoline 1-oxidoreductase beta subunit